MGDIVTYIEKMTTVKGLFSPDYFKIINIRKAETEKRKIRQPKIYFFASFDKKGHFHCKIDYK